MIIFIILLLATALCRAQTYIGLDLSSIIFSEFRIDMGHAISKRWSISASAGVSLDILRRGLNQDEKGHEEELPVGRLPEGRQYLHRENLSLCFWPKDCMAGPFISFGAEYRASSGLDASLGVGYMADIWKGLKAYIKYETGIIRSAAQEKISIQDISAGLCWTF